MSNKISRRDFIGDTSLSLAALALTPLQAYGPKEITGNRSGKGWFQNEPVIMVGCWDTFPLYHRRRQDGNPSWFMEMYKKQQSEDTVKKLADLGVTLAIIHFFKGFGLKAEQKHMEEAKQLTDLCHQHGIKVGVYIGSTIMYETFMLESPEAEKWFVPPYLGRPVRYWDEGFRKRAYFMYPEYVDYLKRVVQIAIKDFNAELLHFDNTSERAIAAVFQHPLARKHFLEYLNNKFSQQEREERFGFSDLTYVESPIGDQSFNVIDDPMVQEWMNFRCQQLSDFCRDMEQYAVQLNPDIVIDHNPSSGFNGHNTMWQQGIDYPRLLKSMDVAWSEEGDTPHVSEDHILISNIRTYKGYTRLGNKVFTYTNESPVEMAEAMIFNRQCLGWVGDMFAGTEIEAVYREYIQFYLRHFDECYKQVENIPDVAVLHTYATMAHNNGRPYQSTWLFEQSLIQGHILWDMIFDENLDDLSKYKVLVLADQESLSDAQIKQIETFVRQGGGLVITEHSSLYSPPHRRRSDFGLAEILPVKASKWPNQNNPSKLPLYPEPILKVQSTKNTVGKGRVAYIPEIIPVKPKPLTADMTNEYWSLPKNWEELMEAVQWAGGNNLSLHIEAPKTVVAEFMKQEDGKTYTVHLLNYDHARTPAVEHIKVNVRIPGNFKIKNITMLSPDEKKQQDLTFSVAGSRISFTVPSLNVYTMIVIKADS